jgi:ssDNA-binding replication factor A large subunit
MGNYDLLIERLAKASGLDKEEIEQRVEAKKAKLSGLISKEGAAQIIAAELNISFEDEELKIAELIAGLRKVNVVGKVMNIFPVREFEKGDRKGKVCNFVLADDSGSTRVVLWDVNHIALIEDGEIKAGDVVSLKNGSTKEGEIHMSGFGALEKSSQVLEDVKDVPATSEVCLDKVKQGMNVGVRGVVVQVFQPRFYNVCPECNKKVTLREEVSGKDDEVEEYMCAEHGKVDALKKVIVNFVLDDGMESIRVVMFSGQVGKIVEEGDLQDEEKAVAFRNDFLGTEVYVSGRVNKNQLFGNLEIVVNDIERVDVDKLIDSLEG